MIKAVKVQPKENFILQITLEDGRVIIHDMNYLHAESGPVADAIKSVEAFKQVFVEDGIITWPSGYDIDPYYLVENSRIA